MTYSRPLVRLFIDSDFPSVSNSLSHLTLIVRPHTEDKHTVVEYTILPETGEQKETGEREKGRMLAVQE